MTDLIDFVRLLTALVSFSTALAGFPRHSSNVRSNVKGVAAAKALTP